MLSFGLNHGYQWILISYIITILLSTILVKRYRGFKYITFPLTIISSGGGILFALMKLLSGVGALEIKLFNGIYPFAFKLYIDNLSAFFILLISLAYLLITLYSPGYMKHYEGKRSFKLFSLCINLFVLSMLLVVTAGQLFFFLIVWEIMALSSYFLVIYEPEKPGVQKAGRFYIIMTHIGTAFIIAAFALMFKYAHTADISGFGAIAIPAAIKSLAFVFLLIGFGTKGGLIPLHIWLPYAHPAAPSNVSALMSGVMLKMAVYGMIRFVFSMLGGDILWWGVLALIVGLISTILGVMYALPENDLKRLLAYSSIENLGIIFSGLGLAILANAYHAPVLTALCLAGALFHTLNHSLFKGLLFMGAGAIHNATGTRDIESLGGLIKKMPCTAFLFLIGALAISAIPPFNGFASEWLIYQSIFTAILGSANTLRVLLIVSAALLAMAGALAAYCFVKVFAISFLAKPRTALAENATEAHGGMLIGMSGVGILCVLAGVFPSLFLKLIDTVNADLIGQKAAHTSFVFSKLVNLAPKAASSSIAPFVMLCVILSIFIGTFALVRLFSRGTKVRKYGTWDCGFKQLTPRMQYTATGFSKLVRIVFRWLYMPKRELILDQSGVKYTIHSAKYIVSTRSMFEDYLYQPIIKSASRLFRRLRFMIQTGSIHQYLVYIFVVLVLMLLYFSWA